MIDAGRRKKIIWLLPLQDFLRTAEEQVGKTWRWAPNKGRGKVKWEGDDQGNEGYKETSQSDLTLEVLSTL